MRSSLIIVTGHPGTGKTTLAHQLGEALDLPVFSKDEIKEVLFDALGWTDATWSRKLSIASYRIIDHAIRNELHSGNGLIIESNFLSHYDSARIAAFKEEFHIPVVQILLYAEESIRKQRFLDRQISGNRHPGHHDLDIFQEDISGARCESLAIDSPLIEIDTTDFSAVDLKDLVKQIRTFIE
ncbi:MAG: AAA family ATPase [Patescibacteria group bacterium]|jgi:predicted kinase